MTTEFKYSLEYGSYYYKINGEIRGMYNEVAILFDAIEEGWILLKHGDPKSVSARAEKMRKAFIFAGLEEDAQQLIVLSGKFPIDKLNRVIQCSGYGKQFYEEITGKKWKLELQKH